MTSHEPRRSEASRRPLRTRLRQQFVLENLESRWVLSAVAEFPLPSSGILPTAITSGPDGNLWFTGQLGDQIGMINPSTDAINLYTLPTGYTYGGGITAGPGGNVYFMNSEMTSTTTLPAIGMINPTTGAITEFPENVPGAIGYDITLGPDGNLWFTNSGTQSDGVGIFNPTTDMITFVSVPGNSGAARGITTGPDGNIWVALGTDHAIAMINPTTLAVTEFSTPSNDTDPLDIATGPYGNLWFTTEVNGGIGTFNLATDTFTQVIASGNFSGITAGPLGDLWFTGGTGNDIGTIGALTDEVNTSALPDPGGAAAGITVGPDGNLWFAEVNGNDIGTLVPVQTLEVNLSLATAQVGTTPPINPSPSVVTPASLPAPSTAFAFTLATPANSQSSGNPSEVTLGLGNATNADTLSISTTHGLVRYSGELVKTHGSFEFVATTRTLVVGGVTKVKTLPKRHLLTETVLTTGKGTNRQSVGVKISFDEALDRAITSAIAGPSARRLTSAHEVALDIVASRSPTASTLNLTGTAKSGNAGKIVVIARS